MRIFFLIAWAVVVLSVRAEEITPAMLEQNPGICPREVTVSVPVSAPILLNGQKVGEIKLPAGRTFPVRGVRGGIVTVEAVQGAVVDIPLSDTDALARAAVVAEALEAARAAATPLPTAKPTPESTPIAEAPPTPEPPPSNAFSKRLTGDLVRLEKRELVPVEPSTLAGKSLIVLYHSASWCGPCRTFTPDLVRFYRRQKSRHDQFDILFVSHDRSAEDMLEYMIEDKMPWPAVAYQRLKDRHPVHDFEVKGIPCLIILDESGQPLPELQVGENYIGANAALKLLEKRLGGR